MPEGEWSFLNSSGERKQINALVPVRTYLVLKATAAMLGMKVSTLLSVAATEYADRILDERGNDLREFVAEERARERSPRETATSTGRSVQGG
jgi:hypothetical protein